MRFKELRKPMPHLQQAILLLLVTLLTLCATAQAEPLPERTALDDYVHKPDDSYEWKVVFDETSLGLRTVVLHMISQTWRTPEEVNRPQWEHFLSIHIPEKLDSTIGGLVIGNGKYAHGLNQFLLQSASGASVLARQTNTVCASLSTVPNQPLTFYEEGTVVNPLLTRPEQERVEDDLVAYTWDKYLKTGDPTWPAFNPMVKSAVRAMDAVTEFMASEEGGEIKIDRFVLTGASKRGWTTWLTAAVDDRVVGIAPLVIDVLNARASMLHHFESYGFWASPIKDYVHHQIMARMAEPRLQELYELIDPYYYRDRLEIPKLVMNATGDQFFLPDSSQFYWDDLKGDKYLRYVPNTDHGLGDSDALESLICFYFLMTHNQQIPNIDWEVQEDGSLVLTPSIQPEEVRLWQANNPTGRDFRLGRIGPAYTSSVIESDADGKYVGRGDIEQSGWTAYFLEATFDLGRNHLGQKLTHKLTTQVKVMPDKEPFKGKDPTQPNTYTLVFKHNGAGTVDVMHNILKRKIPGDKRNIRLLRKTLGEFGYIHIRAADDLEKALDKGLSYLKSQGFKYVDYHIESGEVPTFPPIHPSKKAK
ncbi:MAG: PhoPQ-activated protein PqaA family protein [Planctomycetaceae bacterium]